MTPGPAAGHPHARAARSRRCSAAFGVLHARASASCTGGFWLWSALVVLAVTLLYWGREALRDYDHIPSASTALVTTGGTAWRRARCCRPAPLPAPAGRRRPASTSRPPSFRPLLVAMSMTLLVAGLVLGGWALILGFVALVVTLLGWLRDARREYRAVERRRPAPATSTPGRRPRGRRRRSRSLAWIAGRRPPADVRAAAELQTGEAAAERRRRRAAAARAAAPLGAVGRRSLPAADVDDHRAEHGVRRDLGRGAGRPSRSRSRSTTRTRPAAQRRDQRRVGRQLFMGEIVDGPKVVVYDVPALPAGTYTFVVLGPPEHDGDDDAPSRRPRPHDADARRSPSVPRPVPRAARRGAAAAARPTRGPASRRPPITGTALDGSAIDLAAYRGHPVVVNFWASWCVPCREEFPLFKERLATLGASDGLVDARRPVQGRRRARARSSSTSSARRGRRVTDPDGAIAKAYRTVAPPQTYFIDADGVLRGIQIGEVLPQDFDTQYAKIAP